jgi:hypothetical protein
MIPAAPLWYSAREIAAMMLPGMPTTKRGVAGRALAGGWAHAMDADGKPLARRRAGRGGGIEYHVSLLPEQTIRALDVRERPDAKTIKHCALSPTCSKLRLRLLVELLLAELTR